MSKCRNLQGLLILFSLLFWKQVQAQWSTRLEHQSGRSSVAYGLELDNGALATVALSGDFRLLSSRLADLVMINQEGLVTDQRQITAPNQLPIVRGLHISPTSGDFLLPGVMHDTLAFQSPSSSSLCLWTINSALTTIDVHSSPQGARNHYGGSSCVDEQGNCSVASVAYEFLDGGYQAVVAAKWSSSGSLLEFDTIVNYQGYGKAEDLQTLPNGQLTLFSYHNTDTPPGRGSVGLYHLNSDLSVAGVEALYFVDPSQTFGMNAPFDHLNALALSSGNFIIGGTFSPAMDGQWRSVIQLTNSDAEPIAQHVLSSPYMVDFAGIENCLDMGADGTFLFCQNENFTGNSMAEGEFAEPSRVRILRLDTTLEVLEEFIIDGFTDGHHYVANGVLNARDGGAFVYGHVYDLGSPASTRHREAWVTKIGADQFVGVQQKEALPLTLFPNPGQNMFILSLEQPAHNFHVRLFDTQGRLVLTQQAFGLNIAVDATSLNPGLYAVQLADQNRTVVAAGRWLKE